MKQKFRKILSLQFDAKIIKILTIDFERTMIVDTVNREMKIMTT